MRTLTLVTTNAVINSVNHTISYYVAPDYMAIGSTNDYLLEPMTAPFAGATGFSFAQLHAADAQDGE